MGSTSIWQSEAERELMARGGWAPLDADVKVDVVIIGAGITGLAAALWLARGGARVAVLEARTVAAGASGRNGGFLLSGTSESYAAAITHLGRERARRIWSFSAANHAMVRDLIDELVALGWECGYQRVGSMRIATSLAEMEEIAAGIEPLREDGWRAELVSAEDLPAGLGRHGYVGGAFFPDDAEMHPARFVRGLAWLATDAGALLFTESPVSSISVEEDIIRVVAAGGAVRAQSLLLATNAWSGDLGRQLGISALEWLIMPQRGQMLATEPVAARIIPRPCYAEEGYQYWRQRPDGRLVLGGWRNRSLTTESVMDETPGEAVQEHLDRFLREALNLPDVRIEQRWAGIMGFSPDGLPLVGCVPHSDGVFIAAGYTGHGNAMAVRAARMVADLMLNGHAEDADLLAPERFGEAWHDGTARG